LIFIILFFHIMNSQQQLDTILETIQVTVQDEVASLLGAEFFLTDVEKTVVTKAEAFDNLGGRKICAKFDLTGEVEGGGALFVDMKDAILLAGTLIMLPSSELDEVIDKEEYNAEIEDSYGEIANIICSSFTSGFAENYPKTCRFIKKELEEVVPAMVDIHSDQPVKDEMYYQTRFSMSLDGTELGKMNILLPAAPFDISLDNTSSTASMDREVTDEFTSDSAIGEEAAQASLAGGREPRKEKLQEVGADTVHDLGEPVDILLIGDDEKEVVKLKEVLGDRGYGVRVLSFKDNVNSFISKELKAVYLVTQDVDEQAFGVAIKVSSACSLPLIAAAPGWTKTKVLKAVRYGVRDILLTPASTEDIEENIANNLVKLAA
jgi:hypothetical protein